MTSVYLRLYNEDPSWPLQQPQTFVEELLQRLLVTDNAANSLPILTALSNVLTSFPQLSMFVLSNTF